MIRVQLSRVRTTDSIWGFSLLGSFGDQYKEEITVNYQYDDSALKIETGGSTHSIFIQIMFSPEIQEINRQPSISLLTAIAKIGGLFALLKFSVLLQLWHQSLFVKKMNSNRAPQLMKSYSKIPLSLNNNDTVSLN